jgi:hypothetical protein
LKKIICTYMVALFTFSALTGCSTSTPHATNNSSNEATIASKVLINLEGTVKSISGDEITLEDGKVVIISKDTVFGGDPDTNNEVSNEIAVGNFIQGYTDDAPDADKVTAAAIFYNMIP